jgi:hypothetical protein
MAFSQADLENPHVAENMPSFEESKNVSDDVRGTVLDWSFIHGPKLMNLASPWLRPSDLARTPRSRASHPSTRRADHHPGPQGSRQDHHTAR